MASLFQWVELFAKYPKLVALLITFILPASIGTNFLGWFELDAKDVKLKNERKALEQMSYLAHKTVIKTAIKSDCNCRALLADHIRRLH